MKLLHVTIQTDKFEKEVEFYREMAGLEIVRDMRPSGRNLVFPANGDGETRIEMFM